MDLPNKLKGKHENMAFVMLDSSECLGSRFDRGLPGLWIQFSFRVAFAIWGYLDSDRSILSYGLLLLEL